VPFGGPTCVESFGSSLVDTGNSSGGALVLVNPNTLSDDRSYHWRARIQYLPFRVTSAGITAPTNPAQVSPWRRMRSRADIGDAHTLSTSLFKDSFE
jgi:hypothetical protein